MIDEKRVTPILSAAFVGLVFAFLLFPMPIAGGSFVGHWIGILGTVLMGLTLVYPYRKRILGKKGKKNPLSSHIYYGLIGPSLVVIHSGHRISATIGMFIFVAMLLVVLSGIVGKVLFKKVSRSAKDQKNDLERLNRLFQEKRKEIRREDIRRFLEGEALMVGYEASAASDAPEENPYRDAVWQQCEELQRIGAAVAEEEEALKAVTSLKTFFTWWIQIHIYLSIFLFAMILVHVLTTFYYGFRWL